MGNKGLLESLFDFSFTSHITETLIIILYRVAVFITGLFALFFIYVGFQISQTAGMIMLILGPLFFVIIVGLTRVYLESLIVLSQIARYTEEIARQGRDESEPDKSD